MVTKFVIFEMKVLQFCNRFVIIAFVSNKLVIVCQGVNGDIAILGSLKFCARRLCGGDVCNKKRRE